MVTNLFDPRRDTSPIADPYDEGGLRVWDDYQFRRKGVRWAGGPWPPEPVKPPVILYPPINIVLPVADGPIVEGYSLLCTEGTWIGTDPITYEYQWYRVEVPPAPIPPVNTTLPDISGIESEGSELLCSSGTWSGTAPITYEYQWYREGPPDG
jgi:hypothetical protein